VTVPELLIVMHLGPHNLAEWLMYGALLVVTVAIGVLVVRHATRRAPGHGITWHVEGDDKETGKDKHT
jgi:uncharacterized membrane-anchored protein YhcB (DUF1043 family)